MSLRLSQSLDSLPGIGSARAKALEKLGLRSVEDLLSYFPRQYEDRSLRPDIRSLPNDELACFSAMVTEPFRSTRIRQGMELTKGRIADHTASLQLTFFNQAYASKNLQVGERYLFYGKVTSFGGSRQLANPYFEPEDAPRFTKAIIPIYPLSAGLSQRLLAGLVQESLPAIPLLGEALPEEILRDYSLAQAEFSYRSIHFPASFEELQLARRRLIFEELLCLSLGLRLLRGRREEGGAPVFSKRDLSAFFKQLPFSPTAAQRRAAEEMSADFAHKSPMNRLLQGDVGSGKTAVAAACVALAQENGYQSVLMAPTELLARQHHRSLQSLLEGSKLRIGLLTGSLTAKQKREVRAAAAEGALDLLVGTHALLVDEMRFSRLGLVITDEQHRFGVAQRAALSAKASENLRPHVLVMSATPIPRTLALMVYGDLELSILDELPPGRSPVETLLISESKRARLYGFVERQVSEGRQVYLVCPTVEEGEMQDLKSAEEQAAYLQSTVFPKLRIGLLHGKQKPREKERVMQDFVAGEIQILVSTTVIEVGVDVPNATLMIIENAERFGLSQLHQLRGRVGRGAHQSYCVLISNSKSETSRSRLRALRDTNDGFRIAEEDLKLRGPGDFFGARQHGLPQLHIADLASDMRILKEAQEAAARLCSQDPKLSAPTHRLLREKVLRLFEEHRDSFT